MIPAPPQDKIPLGAEWLQQLPATNGFNPGDGGPIQEVHGLHGTIVVEWLYATIAPRHLGTGTDTNQQARAWVRGFGKPTDDAGHVVGARLGGPGTVWWNIFPQSPHMNRGAYNHYVEQVIAWGQRRGTTHAWYRFLFNDPNRPYRASQLLFFMIMPDGSTRNDEILNP